MTTAARLAHKPIDDAASRARLLRVRDVHVCRGCAFLWLGAVCGVLVAVGAWLGALAGGALLLFGLAGLHPRLYAALPNLMRDVARFGLGVGPLPFLVGSWRAGYWYPALVALWFSGLIVVRAMRARRVRLAQVAARQAAVISHGS